MHSQVAIPAQDAISLWPSGFTEIQILAYATPVIASFALRTAILVDVINRQEHQLRLAAARTFAAVRLHALLLQLLAVTASGLRDFLGILFPITLHVLGGRHIRQFTLQTEDKPLVIKTRRVRDEDE